MREASTVFIYIYAQEYSQTELLKYKYVISHLTVYTNIYRDLFLSLYLINADVFWGITECKRSLQLF